MRKCILNSQAWKHSPGVILTGLSNWFPHIQTFPVLSKITHRLQNDPLKPSPWCSDLLCIFSCTTLPYLLTTYTQRLNSSAWLSVCPRSPVGRSDGLNTAPAFPTACLSAHYLPASDGSFLLCSAAGNPRWLSANPKATCSLGLPANASPHSGATFGTSYCVIKMHVTQRFLTS